MKFLDLILLLFSTDKYKKNKENFVNDIDLKFSYPEEINKKQKNNNKDEGR